MHYVISDIHGCLTEFQSLLNRIGFSDQDVLYVIGDCVDRGPDSVGVLELVLNHDNMIPLMGNHEYLLLAGQNDGSAAAELPKLSQQDREFYLNAIRNFPLYASLTLNDRHFLLIHSLPNGYAGEGPLDLTPEKILFGRPDFGAAWEQERIFITGHTPTFKLGAEYAGKIYHKGNFYDIDCGCVTGHRLGILCLETGAVFYENSLGTYWQGHNS